MVFNFEKLDLQQSADKLQQITIKTELKERTGRTCEQAPNLSTTAPNYTCCIPRISRAIRVAFERTIKTEERIQLQTMCMLNC